MVYKNRTMTNLAKNENYQTRNKTNCWQMTASNIIIPITVKMIKMTVCTRRKIRRAERLTVLWMVRDGGMRLAHSHPLTTGTPHRGVSRTSQGGPCTSSLSDQEYRTSTRPAGYSLPVVRRLAVSRGTSRPRLDASVLIVLQSEILPVVLMTVLSLWGRGGGPSRSLHLH